MALLIADHLNLRKMTAGYEPKRLTDFHRAERGRICQENLTKFESGTWRLCDVVTDDESWLYHKQIDQKSLSSAWVVRGNPSPTVVR